MDLDHFRTILEKTGVDVWTFIDTAVLVASLDYGQELKQRRDRIVERLYASSVVNRCRNCDSGERPNGNEIVQPESNGRGSPVTPRTDNDDEESDPYAGLFDGEQKSILEIKERLEDPDQSEDSLVSLLQSLADMDITFQALQETDIGRHVNQLRKHSSNEVRRLVKQLVRSGFNFGQTNMNWSNPALHCLVSGVEDYFLRFFCRKWKETVQQWVSVNQPGELEPSQLIADADSPQQKIPQNGHLQVPDFGYSPNLQNGTSGLENNNILEPERNPKAAPPLQRDPPAKPAGASLALLSVQRAREQKEQKESFDADRLASARKRLQDNYKEAENAKKQRTIRVMDIHELPKPKKAFFPKNKGSASQGRHW